MNLKTAEMYLSGYRKEKPNDPCFEKAYRMLERDPALTQRLGEQVAFDHQVARAVHAIALPEGLRKRVFDAGKKRERRADFAVATFIAALCGVAVIIGLVVLFVLDRQANFPGSDAIGRIVTSAATMNSLDLVPAPPNTKVGDLGDWFYMRGFEAYQVGPPMAAATAAGSRLFKQEGNSVAQVAVEWHDTQALLYLFRADTFGVELPEGKTWRYLQVEDWEAAVRQDGNNCTVVAFRGDEKEMRSFIESIAKP